MKNSFLPLLAAFALTIGAATAQTTPTTQAAAPAGRTEGEGRMQGTPEEMAKRQSDRMTRELGLNVDQTAKVQQILLTRGQEMQALRTQKTDGANRDQMREQMKANGAKYDEQFKAVLTADQFAKYTTLQAERKGHGKGHGIEAGKMKAKTQDGAKVKVKKAKAVK